MPSLIAVVECADVKFIDDRVFVPERIRRAGRSSSSEVSFIQLQQRQCQLSNGWNSSCVLFRRMRARGGPGPVMNRPISSTLVRADNFPAGEGARFRVWAPSRKRVRIALDQNRQPLRNGGRWRRTFRPFSRGSARGRSDYRKLASTTITQVTPIPSRIPARRAAWTFAGHRPACISVDRSEVVGDRTGRASLL